MSDPTAVPATTASSEAVSASRQPTSPPRRRGVLQMLKLMGPAFIVGAWQFGPGNLVSAVQAGSLYAYDLIWVIVLSTVLMLVFAAMSIRIGISSRGSVVAPIKETLGKPPTTEKRRVG